MSDDGALKKSIVSASGRSSILKGAKFQRGFVIRPEQMLELLHDTQPSLPIPKDAKFEGIGLEDAGRGDRARAIARARLATGLQ